jgi:hypothetical protein
MALIALALLETSQAAEPAAAAPPPKVSEGCLPNGSGFLRARIRGALSLDLNWRNAELECEGGARPNGSGIRLSFAGPLQSDGRRLRMVFGVSDAREGSAGSALPTNLTVIFEGEKRLFSTMGQDRCTVDKLSQERVGALSGPTRSYRVIARGFCIEPVSGLSTNERLVVNSFDFAGKIVFTDSGPPAPTLPKAAPSSAAAKASK